jgi:hypothetical protein
MRYIFELGWIFLVIDYYILLRVRMSLSGFDVLKFGSLESFSGSQYFFYEFYSLESSGERWRSECVSILFMIKNQI